MRCVEVTAFVTNGTFHSICLLSNGLMGKKYTFPSEKVEKIFRISFVTVMLRIFVTLLHASNISVLIRRLAKTFYKTLANN
jgi:hypothetical protein